MITVFSNTGRDLGTNKFPDYDMGVHSKPFYNPTDVESKFKDLSMEMNRKNEVIEEQRKQLEEKDRIMKPGIVPRLCIKYVSSPLHSWCHTFDKVKSKKQKEFKEKNEKA